MELGASPTGGRGARICGIGAYRPRRVVGNDEIATRIGVSPEWILKRSGIRSRRYAQPDETLATMAEAAARPALAQAGLAPDAVDCVVVATVTHLSQMPALAPEVAHRLGTTHAAAFDLSAACAGFCYGLGLAGDLVRAGTCEHVLLIGVERTTDILDDRDPTTAFLFADGAGAVVVGPSPTAEIGPTVWGCDGAHAGAVGMTGFWTRDLRDQPEGPWPVIGMTGWRVFRWATEQLVPIARAAVERAGLTLADLDVFVPHQANLLITQALVEGLSLPDSVVTASDIECSGNTSAASVPLAIDGLRSAGLTAPGAVALLMGFGSGMVYAAQVARLP
jgi:3-oxoacyl-(acyl-carrier-protein) synthase III